MPFEEKAVTKFILKILDLESPTRNKFIPSTAFSVIRPEADRPVREPDRSSTKATDRRHLNLYILLKC
jgi:hypothetical protein